MMSLLPVPSRAARTPRHAQAPPRMRLPLALATAAAGSRFSGTSAQGRQSGRGFVRSASSASGARVTQVPPALPAEKLGSSVVFFCLRPRLASRPFSAPRHHRRHEQEEEAVLGHARAARLRAGAGPGVRPGASRARAGGGAAGAGRARLGQGRGAGGGPGPHSARYPHLSRLRRRLRAACGRRRGRRGGQVRVGGRTVWKIVLALAYCS